MMYKYPEYEVHGCYRQNLCVDCDDTECTSCGDIGADCPKWRCDNDKTLDCENCEFLKGYVAEMREYYKAEKEKGND
jgi:hypothetical protein